MPARGHSTKNFFFKKNQTLPRAGQGALGKEFLEKKIKHLCQGPDRGHSAKNFFFKKNKKSLPSSCRVGTRQSDRQRGRRRDGCFSLPSAPGALGKVFAECPIKNTRQRGLCRSIFCRVFFAECNLAFAKCLRHSAKNLNLVVSAVYGYGLLIH